VVEGVVFEAPDDFVGSEDEAELEQLDVPHVHVEVQFFADLPVLFEGFSFYQHHFA